MTLCWNMKLFVNFHTFHCYNSSLFLFYSGNIKNFVLFFTILPKFHTKLDQMCSWHDRWKVKPENTNLVVFPVEHLVFRSLVNCKRWEGWLESRTKYMISTLGSVFCIWHYCFIKQPTFHIPWIIYLQIWSLLFCHSVPHIQDVQEKIVPYDKGKPLKRRDWPINY